MKYYPLNSHFAAISILGLVVSGVGTYMEFFSLQWGSSFIVLFSIFFIASLITMKETIYDEY